MSETSNHRLIIFVWQAASRADVSEQLSAALLDITVLEDKLRAAGNGELPPQPLAAAAATAVTAEVTAGTAAETVGAASDPVIPAAPSHAARPSRTGLGGASRRLTLPWLPWSEGGDQSAA